MCGLHQQYVIHFRGSDFPEYNNTNVMQLNKMDSTMITAVP